MTGNTPLVTVMIATRDRPEDLRQTLRLLRELEYPAIEMLVIDDGSTLPAAPLVLDVWPDARVIRHDIGMGQCTRRNEGFALASGRYILHLDDDCALVGRNALRRAVELLEGHPKAAALVPYLYNGLELPPDLSPVSNSGCVLSFVGACVLLRKEAISKCCGYREFFASHYEEDELSLQLISGGWYLWYRGDVVAHHRLSPRNRQPSRAWQRGLRNMLWSILMHMPAKTLALELGWKIGMGAWDAVRLRRPVAYLNALREFFLGSPRVSRLRNPMNSLAYRRVCRMRSGGLIQLSDFEAPGSVRFSDMMNWFARWRGRARDRSFWDPRPGDTGTSITVGYAHESKMRRPEVG